MADAEINPMACGENARFKNLLADAMRDNATLKELPQKCMVCPARAMVLARRR
jgi:hypothetical protein